MTQSHSAEETAQKNLHRRAVVLMTVLATLVILKLGAPVLMPLAVAIFLVALVWPVKQFLGQYVSPMLANAGALLTLGAVVALFLAALWFSASEIFATAPTYKDEVSQMWRHTKQELATNGVDTHEKVSMKDVRAMLGLAALNVNDVVIQFLVIISYVALALPEMNYWKPKLRTCFGKDKVEKILDASGQLSRSFQLYLKALLISGVISAVGMWIICFATGLDFAFTWGIMAFFMSYIPVIGPVLMIFPPTAFAFLQFTDPATPVIVFLSTSILQMVVGNILEPKLQGNMLAMSPLVVLFSLVLWGFLWGIPGALLAAPLTHALMIICDYSNRTRWIGCLLGDSRATPSNKPNCGISA